MRKVAEPLKLARFAGTQICDRPPSSTPRTNQGPIMTLSSRALAEALRLASEAGKWDVVATLARELQARREARSGVVGLEVARKPRDPP